MGNDGEEGWPCRRSHFRITMWWDFPRWCLCTLYQMRHTQLFACLLLLEAREWLHFHWGQQKCSTTVSLQTSLSWLYWQSGHPTGLNVSNTRLTAYNSTQIPILDHFMGLSTGSLAPPVHNTIRKNSCWYVSDTPGPAILGLPSCKSLGVVKMNCAVKVIKDTSKLPGPTPAPAAPPTPIGSKA